MPLLIVDAGELTGRLREGAEARVIASLPAGHTGGRIPVIEAVHVYYRLEPVVPDKRHITELPSWGGVGC